nr:hypothetical protein CFP56_00273 [Quercus suber]
MKNQKQSHQAMKFNYIQLNDRTHQCEVIDQSRMALMCTRGSMAQRLLRGARRSSPALRGTSSVKMHTEYRTIMDKTDLPANHPSTSL